jgi:hypothetical protein
MSLREQDLRDLVYKIIEIDSYASKMGNDENIVTVSFSLKTKEAADDLTNFVEKGYSFVLDADATSGEQRDGTYKVFVEIERTAEVNDQILELVDGVSKLTNVDQFRFRYYKDFRSLPVSAESLAATVPTKPENYGITIAEARVNNYKEFFNRSFLDSVDLVDNTLTISKKYADPLKFEVLDFIDQSDFTRTVTEAFDFNSYPEILFLTKYIGDYNICKYGDKIVFDNHQKCLIALRK